TNSGAGRRLNRSLAAHSDGRVDDVFFPITAGGRDIARERESRKRRESNVMRATDASFEHSAAPDGNASLSSHVVNFLCFGKAANAAEFNIDDPARAQF